MSADIILVIVVGSTNSSNSVRLVEVALDCGARTAYRITRSKDGVRVDGRSDGRNCVLEECSAPNAFSKEMLRDQPLYRITSPLLTS